MPNKNNFHHGHSGSGRAKRGKASPEYAAWASMRKRCNNPNVKSYKFAGARGFKVHPRWDDFTKFLHDIGPRPHPDFVLDRIDNGKGYFPGNVRWVDRSTSNKNRRSSNSIYCFSTAELEAELHRRKLLKVDM